MKISEMRDLPVEEIREELEKTREKLFRTRFQAKGKDLENPGQMKTWKKDIARLLTVLRQREKAAERDQAQAAAPTEN